jgi:hypothetical protein
VGIYKPSYDKLKSNIDFYPQAAVTLVKFYAKMSAKLLSTATHFDGTVLALATFGDKMHIECP